MRSHRRLVGQRVCVPVADILCRDRAEELRAELGYEMVVEDGLVMLAGARFDCASVDLAPFQPCLRVVAEKDTLVLCFRSFVDLAALVSRPRFGVWVDAGMSCQLTFSHRQVSCSERCSAPIFLVRRRRILVWRVLSLTASC